MGKCLLLKSGSGGVDPDELTAHAEDVLINKKAGVTGNDEPVVGTMPNRGAVSQTLNCGNSYTIPAGYHNGSGKVTANSLSSQTSANATSSQILAGQTAWVNGSKITGSMTNRGAINQSLGINGSYTVPAGYHNGGGKITQSIAVQGGSTTTPGTSNKTIVSANRYVNGNIIVAGSSNLTSGNIKKGVNLFGVTGSWEGYVTTAKDLYKYGVNNGGFASVDKANSSLHTVTLESNQIHIYAAGDDYWEDDGDGNGNYYDDYTRAMITTSSAFNLTGYNTITATFNIPSCASVNNQEHFVEIGVMATKPSTAYLSPETLNRIQGASVTTGNKTLTLNISNINAARYITFRVSAYAPRIYINTYIYQISLS